MARGEDQRQHFGLELPRARFQARDPAHGQSALIPADLITGHHFSISALWCAPSTAGVCWSRGGISWPRSPRRLRTLASASVSTIASLTFVTTAFDVPAGTQTPCHTAM